MPVMVMADDFHTIMLRIEHLAEDYAQAVKAAERWWIDYKIRNNKVHIENNISEWGIENELSRNN